MVLKRDYLRIKRPIRRAMTNRKGLTSSDNRDKKEGIQRTIVAIERAMKGLEKNFIKLKKDLRLLPDKRD